MCCSQNPQNHNFHSDFIIPHPDCHRWKIPWICSLPTVGVPGRGHESSLAGNGEVTPESTWSWAHRRRETAELQDWVWEFHPSSAAVLAKQSWEIKDALMLLELKWRIPSPAEHRGHLFYKKWGCWMCCPHPNIPDHSQESRKKRKRSQGKVRICPSLPFPLPFPMLIPPPLPFPSATPRTNLVPQQKMLFIHFHYICASLLLSSLFLVLSCFSSRVGR